MKAPKKKTKKVVAKKKKSVATKRVAPKKKDLVVVSPVDPSIHLIVASEMSDDAVIESELMGEVLPYFVYKFNNAGKETTGLSVKGVSEVVRRLNRDKKSGYNIRIHPQYQKVEHNIDQDGDKGVQVSVYAENMLDGNSAWGIKFESYYKTGKNGRYKNEFAVEKALAKAERNAKRKLIPEQVAVKMIEKMISTNPNTVKQLEPVKTTARIVQPIQQQPSSIDDLKNLIRRGVRGAKNPSTAIEFDQRTQLKAEFDQAFKDEIHSLASARVDELTQK